MKQGVLYGVSVGPGDPELLTQKALRVVGQCPVIAAPQTLGGEMMALDILRQALPVEGKTILPLTFTMAREESVREEAHALAAALLIEQLQSGRDVAMLNLGDVSIYSTFGHLMGRIQKAGYRTEMIPGVPSFCAVAARLGVLLAEQETAISIHAGSGDLSGIWDTPGTKVLMKSGRQLPAVLTQLAEQGKLEQSALVCNCGLPNEQVVTDLRGQLPEEMAGYFTTIIVKE